MTTPNSIYDYATTELAIGRALEGALITRQSKDGTSEFYAPASDTDTARGDALILAFAALVNGDSLILNSGIYDVGNNGIESLFFDFTITGIGNVIIKTIAPTGLDIGGFHFGSENYISMYNIKWQTTISDASYGSGHAYNVIINGIGECKDCYFVFDSSMTTIDVGKSLKNIVQLGENRMEITTCKFISIGTATVENVHGAFHSSGGLFASEFATCNGCYFLGQYTSSAFFNSKPNLIDCWSNEPSDYNMRLLNLYIARSLTADFSSLIDESFYKKYAMSLSPDTYEFSGFVDNTAGDRVIFEIEDSAVSGTVGNYEIEINCGYTIGGYGDPDQFFHYKAIVKDGVARVITEHDTVDDIPLALYLVKLTPNPAGNDLFTLTGRTQGVQRISGTVMFKPVKRGNAELGVESDSQYGSFIRFFDVSE